MANKQLTVSVRLNTNDVERKINRLGNLFNKLNNSINKSANTQLENQLKRSATAANKVGQEIKNWSTNMNSVLSKLRPTNSILGGIWTKLKGIAATYLGIMGTRAVLNTTDLLVGAQNRLNYVSANNLGDAGFDAKGNYSTTTLNATQEALDKMYASSQKVRTSYQDMMTNVSKTMTLAGDAFDNNTDNAIRFQEIMAEAYAVGGATAQEQASSMYQMTQALGAGILAGDELRSVREGAPLAYQAIEEFAQGVLNTDESLKELASQGKITSDMVVAAIMNAGDKLDNAFKQTQQTFGQTLDQIKNAAMYALQPVMKMLSKALNEALDNGLVSKFETFFTNVAKGIMIVFKLISNAVSWIADNWSWLKDVVVAGLITIITYLTILKIASIAVAIAQFAAWAIANPMAFQYMLMLGVIVLMISAVIYAIYQWAQGTITTTELILACIAIIAIAIMLLGLVFKSMTLFVVGAALLVITWIASQSANLCEFLANLAYIVMWAIVGVLAVVLAAYLATGAVMLSVPMLIALAIIALIAAVAFAFFKYTEEVMGCVYAAGAFFYNLIAGVLDGAIQAFYSIFVEPIAGIIEWFINAWNGAFTSVGGAFANFCGQLLSGLVGLLKPFAKILDKVFGWNTNGAIESAQSAMKGWGKAKNAISYKVEVPTVSSISKSLGFDLPDRFSYSDSYDKGMAAGSNIRDKINSVTDSLNGLGSKYKNQLGGLSLDNIGKKLGLNFNDMYSDKSILDKLTDMYGSEDLAKQILANSPGDIDKILGTNGGKGGSGFPNASDPAYNVGGAYKTPEDLLKSISGDTDSIADAMDLTAEDLEYLRKIADMEWKKEYTTAEIKVEMNNNNQINGDGDLDGIVTKLADKLYEEMNVVANGVYAY